MSYLCNNIKNCNDFANPPISSTNVITVLASLSNCSEKTYQTKVYSFHSDSNLVNRWFHKHNIELKLKGPNKAPVCKESLINVLFSSIRTAFLTSTYFIKKQKTFFQNRFISVLCWKNLFLYCCILFNHTSDSQWPEVEFKSNHHNNNSTRNHCPGSESLFSLSFMAVCITFATRSFRY